METKEIIISEIDDGIKTIMLSKAMGWETTIFNRRLLITTTMVDGEADVLGEGTLYDENNMALAWRVLTYGLTVKDTDPIDSIHSPDRIHNRLSSWLNSGLWGDPNAQRKWLDKILELLVEDGILN